VRRNSLTQLYSSKTDEELLALAAEHDSLIEEARSVLAGELQRRKLPSGAGTTIAVPQPLLPSGSLFTTRAKWVGLWLVNTLISTVGVAFTVGLLTYSTQSFVSRATRIRFLLTPYYPVPIIAGLVIGYFSYTRFKGSYRYWTWVVPAALVILSLLGWKDANQTSWSAAAFHFFGPLPYPENHDQQDTSVVLYMSIAYSLGTLIQAKLHGRLKRA
jgi:hypothetical protein